MATKIVRLRMKRGKSADFDEAKLLPGEFAILEDLEELYICLNAGNVLRVPLYPEVLDLIDNKYLELNEKTVEILNKAIDLHNENVKLQEQTKKTANEQEEVVSRWNYILKNIEVDGLGAVTSRVLDLEDDVAAINSNLAKKNIHVTSENWKPSDEDMEIGDTFFISLSSNAAKVIVGIERGCAGFLTKIDGAHYRGQVNYQTETLGGLFSIQYRSNTNEWDISSYLSADILKYPNGVYINVADFTPDTLGLSIGDSTTFVGTDIAMDGIIGIGTTMTGTIARLTNSTYIINCAAGVSRQYIISWSNSAGYKYGRFDAAITV